MAPRYTRKDLPANLQDPATKFVPITPSAAYLEKPIRALYVGQEGNVVCEDMDGTVGIFRNVPSGTTIIAVIGRVLVSADGVQSVTSGLVGLR